MKNRGVLLFAFNNERMDYLRIAAYCANRIKRFWRLPVAVVTDEKDRPEVLKHFDHVIPHARKGQTNLRLYPDYGEKASFYNTDRVLSLHLTPFDETIVLDADYLVGSDSIPAVWATQPLLVARHAVSLSDQPLPEYLQRLHVTTAPMYWATVLAFDRHSDEVRKFFYHYQQAIKFYQYYANLYKFEHELFRNDYAVSVAIQLMTAGVPTTRYDLPHRLPTALPDLEVESVEPIVLSKAGRIFGDVHVMHKKSLLEQICGLPGF